jgi:integrase
MLTPLYPQRINRITVTTVERFISNLREKGAALPTVKKVLITLGQVFKYAVRNRYIDHNPVSDAERLRGRGEEEAPAFRVLKTEEINRLIEATTDPEARMLLLLAVMSGARQGEPFGLKWSDVLWETNQIHIQRTFNNGAWCKPKSKHSNRRVDLAGQRLWTPLNAGDWHARRTSLTLYFRGRTASP